MSVFRREDFSFFLTMTGLYYYTKHYCVYGFHISYSIFKRTQCFGNCILLSPDEKVERHVVVLDPLERINLNYWISFWDVLFCQTSNRLHNITSHSSSGSIFGILENGKKFGNSVLLNLSFLFGFQSEFEAAQTSVFAAIDTNLDEVTGQFFCDCQVICLTTNKPTKLHYKSSAVCNKVWCV
jgi:hypothetical protein